MKTRQLRGLIAAGVVVALGIVTAVWYTRPDKTGTVAPPAAKGERKVLYWTDPMTPGFKSDKPGKSPFMDMELVPVYEDEAQTMVVSVRPEIVQNLGVRTYTVTRGSQPRRVATTGYLFRDARGFAVLVDLIDRDASFVRAGSRAEVRVADVPDRTWGGTVEEIESDVDIGARTLKARVRLSRAEAVLKPNMFAEVTILGIAAGKQALFIPREALIRTGSRNAVVLALGSGRFQPVEVTPGFESDDWIEIRHGIKEGDVVVTSGQFLIDSEASVRASFSRMQSMEPDTSGAAGETKTPAGDEQGRSSAAEGRKPEAAGAHTGH